MSKMAIEMLTAFVYRRRFKLMTLMFVILLTGRVCAYLYFRGSSSGAFSSKHRQDYTTARNFIDRNLARTQQENESHGTYNSKIIGVRQRVCDGCFDIKFKPLVSPHKICEKGPIKLVIFVTTVLQDKNARDAIRQSWASASSGSTPQIRYFFIIGNSVENDWLENIQNEMELYKDIVMYDFIDVYQNLTIKTVLGFQHALKYCPGAAYVMKTDTDVFVNVPEILKLISYTNYKRIRMGNAKKYHSTVSNVLNERDDRKGDVVHMFGTKWNNTRPIRTATGKHQKWHVSEAEYAGHFYPDYLDGHGYILSRKAATDVVRISRNIPFFKFEDVYIGLCLKQLGYQVTHTKGFIRINEILTLCTHKHNHVFTVHGVSHEMMTSIWLKNCSHSDPIGLERNSKSNRWIKLPQNVDKNKV